MTQVPPWSYSSLTKFETCPRQYYITRVAKLVTEPPTEATTYGTDVHKAFEDAVRDNKALPEKYSKWQPIVDKVQASDGLKLTELQIALDRSFRPVEWFAKDAWCRGIVDLVIEKNASASAWDWKGLALDVPIPTPSGWSTMGDIQVGAQVFGADGKAYSVVGKSEVQHKKCYRLTFDDTTTVICDEDHLWEVGDSVISASAIAAMPSLKSNGCRSKLHVRLCDPVSGAGSALPVHPYVLGAWLGDGKHSSGEISKPDRDFWGKIESFGYSLGADTGRPSCATRTVLGLMRSLRSMGVLKNKHIPEAYLRASVQQRIDLVRGLFDSDGNVNSIRKQAVFTTCSKALSDRVVELLCSLGQRPLQSKTTQRGFGLTVTAWPISFKPLNGFQPFYLPRKAEKVLASWGNGRSGTRRIVRIEEVPSVPTQCISVASPDSTYLCTNKFLVTHNTGRRKPDSTQLMLFAALLMQSREHLERVSTAFVWLKDGKTDKASYSREDLRTIWLEFIPRTRRVEAAYESDKWMPKPSGLCNGWCPVGRAHCEFWKPKKGA